MTQYWNLSQAKVVIILAGCLATAFVQLSTSPATVAFARKLGATGWQLGILGALPTGLLLVQLLAAVLVRRLRHRKPLFMIVTIAQRISLLPAALGPWLFPQLDDSVWVWSLLGCMTVSYLLGHFTNPLWLSWMGDYLPHHEINRFWGIRELWNQWTAALTLFATACLIFHSGLDARQVFALVITVGSICGVADILLFTRVYEPPVHVTEAIELKQFFLAPFQPRDFRSFIRFSCAFQFAANIGSPFISLLMLEYCGMNLFQVLLAWAFSWIGGAVFSRQLGILTEKYGQRPMLILCTAGKSLNMLVLLFLPPQQPTLALGILIPVFMFDSMLNSGMTIANNGFMIKHSPREQRTIFIAAGNAFAGLVGGVASLLAGILLSQLGQWTTLVANWPVTPLHVVFAISLVLRLGAAVLARTLEEPTAAPPAELILSLVRPIRMLSKAG